MTTYDILETGESSDGIHSIQILNEAVEDDVFEDVIAEYLEESPPALFREISGMFSPFDTGHHVYTQHFKWQTWPRDFDHGFPFTTNITDIASRIESRLVARLTAGNSLRTLFESLVAHWREQIFLSSSTTERITNPYYLQIIGLGPRALPLIFEELRVRGGHWYPALEAITRANPVASHDLGNVPRMREAWLAWWRTRAIVS